MGPSYSAGLPHSFQGGTLSSARSSTIPVFRGSDEAFAQGGIFLAGSSGDQVPIGTGRATEIFLQRRKEISQRFEILRHRFIFWDVVLKL